MRTTTWMLSLGLVAVLIVSSGCENWQKKYQLCNVELENLKELYDGANDSLMACEAQRAQLNQDLMAAQNALNKPTAKPNNTGGLGKEGGVYDAGKGTITVTLENSVLFSSGSVALKSDSKTRLQRIASIIRREHSGKEVWVIGHTDTDPIKKSKWKDNWELSTQRSLSVLRYLLNNGVAAKRLVAAGRGEFLPVSSSKSNNRRVEIVVYVR